MIIKVSGAAVPVGTQEGENDDMRLSEVPDGTVVAVDTETSGTRVDDGARVSVVSYAFRHPQTNAVVRNALPFDQGVHALPLGDKDIPRRHLRRLAKWSEAHQAEVAPNLPPERYSELIAQLVRFQLVYHNRKFDEVMLATGLRHPDDYRFWEMYYLNGNDPRDVLAGAFTWDTMVATNTIAPQYPVGLKPTATRLELMDGGEDESAKALDPFLGPRSGKDADPRYDLVPWSVVGPYAADDAVNALLLAEWQMEFIADGQNKWMRKLLTTDFDETTTLIHMEYRGMGWDVPRAKKMVDLLRKEKKVAADVLPFKGGTGEPTPQSAKKFFFTDPGRRPYPGKITDTCRKTHPKDCTSCPQLDTEVQENLIRDGVEWAPEYHHHEKVKSALSKWYEGWTEKVGPDGRLRCDFDQVGVATGRLGGRHINLVAIPKDGVLPDVPDLIPVRQLIIPKPGHRLWHIDMGQAEVRVGAALAECEGLLQGFQSGVDAHSQMSILIFGDAEPRHRRIAKTLNLAIQYGAGIKKIKAQLEKDTGERWSLDRTKEIRNAWHQAAPEMGLAMDTAQHQAETLGYVRLWNGRFRWFEHYRGGPPDLPWTAFNAQCQGGVAEVMKICMNRVDQQFPGILVDQIHDALVLEIDDIHNPVDTCRRVADLMVSEFEQAMTKTWKQKGLVITMPFVAEIEEWSTAA